MMEEGLTRMKRLREFRQGGGRREIWRVEQGLREWERVGREARESRREDRGERRVLGENAYGREEGRGSEEM